MDQPRIFSIGEVLWDLFPEGARFGGAPANFACHAAALGGEVTMVSAVGDDERGREAIEVLEGYGIDVSLVTINSGVPTGTVGIELDGQGKPAFTIHEGSAWDEVPWTPALERKLAESDAVYFGTLGQRGAVSRETICRALKQAAAAGIPRVLDVNLRAPFFDAELIRQSIELASILKLSDDELEEVCTAAAIGTSDDPARCLEELRREFQLELVVMTRGERGALLVSSGGAIDQPGVPTTVRDTVGAGDAFAAAFLLGCLARKSFPEILRQACEVASEVCAHDGAVPDLSGITKPVQTA